jgi:23S rRNA pseudouridine1911/1915/1917 synthase
MAQQYKVIKRGKLLEFLFANLDGWSKKTIKQRLQGSSVAVNGVITTKHDFILNENDVVEVGVAQRTGKAENKEHALALLRTQLTRGKERVQLWPVHRLDRDTSGILLFATSKEVREAIMAKWSVTEKTYLAVVEGKPKEEKGTITKPLRLDEQEYRMHVGEHKDAKSAITHYKLLESSDKHSLLEVNIETGRQHQIRAHMAWMGNLGLHSMRLSIIHPKTKKPLTFEVDAPRDFYGLLN